MKMFKNFLLKYTKTAVVVPILISLLLGIGIFKVKIKDDVVEMLPKNMPSRVALREFEANFGASEFICITIGTKDKSVFNPGTLEKLARITEELEEVPFIDRVRSLANISKTEGSDFGLDVYPLMEEVPTTPEEIKELEESVFDSDSGYVGALVSEDKHYFSVYAFLTLDLNDSGAAYHAVREVAEKAKGPEEVYISGMPVIAGMIGKAIRKDLTILVPLVALILVIILYLGLRNITGVLLILLIIVLSVLPTIGLMGIFNRPFMVVNSAMPVILLALSCAYSIHVIMKFYSALSQKKSKRQTVIHTIDELFIPITATSLTTIVGFLSLVTSPLPILFEFGIFVSIGILWAWLLSITALPALLILLPTPKIKNPDAKDDRGLFHKLSTIFSYITTKLKVPVVIFFAIITIIFGFGVSKLRIESSVDRFFGKDSEVRRADKIAGEHFGGSATLNIILEGDLLQPKVLNEMLDIQEYLEEMEGIGSASSIANVICSLNQAVHNNDRKFKAIPPTSNAVSQLLLLYSMSGDPEDFAMMINSDYTLGHINIRMASMYSEDVKKIKNKIDEYMPKHFPDDIKYSITGSSMFTMELSRLTAISSLKSIIVSLIAVFLIGLFLYRSVAFGLLNIIPLSITMTIIFGFMGFARIDFSLEIAIICSIIIGVGIDYALHYTAKYCLLANTMSQDETARTAIAETGPPILSNAISIALGFITLLLSLLMPIKSLGLLVAISMMLAAIITLTLLSSILNIVKPKIKHRILVFEEEPEEKP